MKVQSLFSQTLGKLFSSLSGVLSLSFILLCGLVAVFAYLIAPDDSKDANQMHLSIHSQPPLFSVTTIKVPEKETANNPWIAMFIGKDNPNTEIPIQKFRVSENGIFYVEYAPDGFTGEEKLLSWQAFPSSMSHQDIVAHYIRTKTFWLGTDKYGRDMLSRLLIGTRISFSVGFIAVFISLVLGITLGVLSGYFGGYVDSLVMWLINVVWSIPTLLLVIALTLVLGKGYGQVFLAVGLTMWVEVARMVRGQTLSLKKLPYIEAGKALGFSHFRIITRHILPNLYAPLIIISVANFASAILIESGLSFLGVGAQPPTPSWGNMIKDHYNYIILGKAYMSLIPGIALMLLIVSFMILGNRLRDIFDIKN